MNDTVTAPPVDETVPQAAAPAVQTAAPGSPEPEKKRVTFPPLEAAGGQFADGKHFVSNSLPQVGAWPVMYQPDPANPGQALLDAAGQPVVQPLPWEEHNNNAYLALRKDCFTTEQGYFYYRAWLAHSKYQTAVEDLTAAANGGLRDANKVAAKTARMIKDIESMAGALSGVEGIDIEALLKALGQKKEAAAEAAAKAATEGT